MAKILSCINLKGGVGKTALAVNVAAFAGRQGLKTLLVDLDPQTNATFWCMEIRDWQKYAAKHGTVADLFGLRSHANAEGSQRDPSAIIKADVFHKVDLLPSHLDLFTIDLDLGGATARETRLRRSLQPVLAKYDVVVCDCPPNLTIPTQNALAMSTHYVIPVSPDYLSGIGVGILLNRVKKFGEELELKLENAGIVLSRVGRTSYHRVSLMNALRQQFGDLVFKDEIKERTAVSNAAAKHSSVYDFGDKEAASEFADVSIELLKRMRLM